MFTNGLLASTINNTGRFVYPGGKRDIEEQHRSHGSKVRLVIYMTSMLKSWLNDCSVWVFVLLGVEAIKAYRANPYFA